MLHDFTDLREIAILWRNEKCSSGKGGGMGCNNRLISITVFSLSLEAKIKMNRKYRMHARSFLESNIKMTIF